MAQGGRIIQEAEAQWVKAYEGIMISTDSATQNPRVMWALAVSLRCGMGACGECSLGPFPAFGLTLLSFLLLSLRLATHPRNTLGSSMVLFPCVGVEVALDIRRWDPSVGSTFLCRFLSTWRDALYVLGGKSHAGDPSSNPDQAFQQRSTLQHLMDRCRGSLGP